MRKTTNYGLSLYDKEDKMNITAEENSLNANMEIIDSTLKNKASITDMTNYINEHKDELKGADGKDGANGKDGISTTHSWNGTTLTVTSASGTSSANLKGDKGDKGDSGSKGNDGIGIKSVTQTTTSNADGGSNVITVTKTDGTTSTFAVKNGSKGSTGATGAKGAAGYTPVKGTDYWTENDKKEIKEYVKDEIPTKTSQLTNDSGFLTEVELTQEQLDEIAEKVVESQKVEFVESIDECVDTSKKYVLPDGYIYAYTLTDIVVGPSYTNVLPLAINADGTPYVGTNGEKGYKTGYRLNSSRVETQATNRCCTGFIPVKHTDTIRFKNISNPKDNNINGYIHFYGDDFSSNTGMMYELGGCWDNEIIPSQVKNVSQGSVNATDKTAYMRISTGIIDDTSIVTINEEIVEGTTIKDYAWVNTGMTFVQSENEDRIVALETLTKTHSVDIENLKKGITNTTDIAEWDAPIYDAHIPVFELSEEKQAMTNATNTPDNIYAMYDALMAKHPRYITKTDLGLCSDGINHVYRYDFCEPEPLHESNKVWSETKAKAIITTGIHFEWAGIYAMYYALEEIANNPELRDFRRNTHLIVVPVANPYATIASNYQSGLSTPNSYGVRNANGVEIHRNFEVDWILNEASNTHYGGPEPLSEVETQYIDNIMKNNTDAAFFVSCHNCGVDTFWGTGFIWASTATKYMCNVGYRVIDKMSDAWMSKYGEVLSAGIEEYKTDSLEDGETRLGWTGMSTSPGTEAKQATKYGIQGTNVEICNPFQIHGTKENPESSMSSFTMSRGAEVYTNFLLTAFGVYDFKDKKEYS